MKIYSWEFFFCRPVLSPHPSVTVVSGSPSTATSESGETQSSSTVLRSQGRPRHSQLLPIFLSKGRICFYKYHVIYIWWFPQSYTNRINTSCVCYDVRNIYTPRCTIILWTDFDRNLSENNVTLLIHNWQICRSID